MGIVQIKIKFHPDEVSYPVYNCSLYVFNSQKLSELEQHMWTCHPKFTNCCRSCFNDSMGFNDAHLLGAACELHSIAACFLTRIPREKCYGGDNLNGVLQTYEIVNNETCRDLVIFILNLRSAIPMLIEPRLRHGPQFVVHAAKVQFAVKVQLLKFNQDENSTKMEELVGILQTLSWPQFTLRD